MNDFQDESNCFHFSPGIHLSCATHLCKKGTQLQISGDGLPAYERRAILYADVT